MICVNSDDQILVVQEASGPAALRQSKTGTAFWKLPTGLVNQGEDLCAAAVRETREETGIDVDFVQLASIRDGHKALHGKDNLFCVCIVKPRTSKIRVQTSELADARWMPVDEFLALPYYAPATAYGELNRAAIDCLRGRRGGLSGHSLPEKFRRARLGSTSGSQWRRPELRLAAVTPQICENIVVFSRATHLRLGRLDREAAVDLAPADEPPVLVDAAGERNLLASAVQTGAVSRILARSAFTAWIRPPVDVEPMFTWGEGGGAGAGARGEGRGCARAAPPPRFESLGGAP